MSARPGDDGRLKALHELTLGIGSIRSTGALIGMAVEQIVRIVAPDAVFFYLREGDGLRLRESWQRPGGRSRIPPSHMESGVCLCGLAAAENRPVYSIDIHRDARCTLEECKLEGIRSFAALPLAMGTESIGILSLASFTTRDFQEESAFLEILSGQISAAVTNARFLEDITLNRCLLQERISDLAKAQGRLRESEAQYRLFFDASPLPMWVYDMDTLAFLAVNETAVFHYGYSREEFLSMTIREIRPAEDIPILMERVAEVRTGLTRSGRWRHRKKNGAIIWVEITSHEISFNGRRARLVLAKDITQGMAAEEAARESGLRFSSLVQASTDAIIMSDGTGAILSWNTGAGNMFGYEQDEAIDRPLTMLMPERYRTAHEKGIERIVSGGESRYLGRVLRLEGLRRDGSEFPLELCVNTYPTPRGILFLGIIRDISQQVDLERSLIDQKMFAESLVENSAVATFVIDRDHKVVLWNAACRELTGISAGEIVGTDDHWKPFYAHKRKTLADIVIDGYSGEPQQLYDKLRRSPLISNGLQSEGWRRNVNGKDRYILFEAAPMTGGSGGTAYAIETILDITDVKKLEEELAESRERLRAIVDTEPHCVKLLSREGNLIEMNPAGLAIIDADSLEQVKGHCVFPLVAEESRAAFEAHLARVFEGFSETIEFEIVSLKGVAKWLSSHSVPFRDRSGSIVALLGITRDVTEQRRLEDQLRHSQKLEGIGQLAGGIAHDFNNILSAIVGFGTLAQMNVGRNDHQVSSYLKEVLSAAQRAASLTQQILAFSRKQILDVHPVSLNEMLANLMKMLHRLIREDIEMEYLPSRDRLVVLADGSQIDQVVINLVANARDAMPEGGKVTISTRPVSIDEGFLHLHGYGEAGTYALLSITDTGMGMDEKTQGKIFEPFFTTKEIGKGTGLGLAVVYGIVKQHKGFIDVYSEPGKGTTFKIYLPLAEADASKEYLTTSRPPRGGSETILVADDDDALRALARTLLEEYGYTVIDAKNGEDVVARYREHRNAVKMLLLDAIMPVKSGKEAFDEIRAIDPGVRAIFLSGYPKDTVSPDALAAQGAVFLTKPIMPGDLLRKIREVLDG